MKRSTPAPAGQGACGRANQTLQDRLVKELRLGGINDMASANVYLPAILADFNSRYYAVAPVRGRTPIGHCCTARKSARAVSSWVMRSLIA